MKPSSRIFAVAALATLWALPVQAKPIVVGGKNYTEQLLLAEVTAQLLKKKGFEVDKRDGLGSQVLRDAQIGGQIDVYWEYTGTSLVTYNKINERLSAKDTYQRVKELDAKLGLTWLQPSSANNTYALAVRADDPKTVSIKTLSDLAAAFNAKKPLSIAVNAEFSGRPDGLPGLQTAYDFKAGRANLKSMDSGLTYQALRDSQVDAALVFATDGRIQAFKFRVLADDKEFFPNYAAVPVVRAEALKANPALEATLNALSGKLSDEILQALNAKVDVDKTPIEEVARQFLAENNLI
ncbi:glycine/betaine ABC transporter substrate-binding protein [Bosea sp. WAO]|uniref:glycine betaine ABC transporter substrate-binding protein n=1 Tax=Bosea sp. WAO TaxID=406341 RepID=UPI000745FCAE|nr:glycine betaine ABC transporter substrate-binding protein [Bosea sp. WAO]KUL95546.1 glycine/betaine ABC transporter substrate-binding protein [Bosea sp. WAO]